MTVINPFDFFLRGRGERVSVRLRRCRARPSCCRIWKRCRTARGCRSSWPACRAKHKRTVDFLVDLNQYVAPGGQIRDPHGAGRADLRGDAGAAKAARAAIRPGCWCRCCGNLGLAARFVSGYLIQLQPDMKPLDGPPGPQPISPTCTPGPRSICPARAGSGSTPPPACWPAKGHLPLAATPNPDSAAPISGGVEPVRESSFFVEMSVTRVADAPRVTKPYTEEQWAAVEQLGHKVDARLGCARRAADDGRRADLRLDRRHGRRRVEHDRRRPDKAATGRHAAAAACRTATATGPCCTSARANGIPASSCRAGPWAATGARTASRSGDNPELIAADDADYRANANAAQRVHPASGRAAAGPQRRRPAGLRRRLVLPVEGAPAAGQRRSA